MKTITMEDVRDVCLPGTKTEAILFLLVKRGTGVDVGFSEIYSHLKPGEDEPPYGVQPFLGACISSINRKLRKASVNAKISPGRTKRTYTLTAEA